MATPNSVRTRPKRARTSPLQQLAFDGVHDPVLLDGAPGLPAVLDQILLGWPCQTTVISPAQRDNAQAAALSTVVAAPGGLTAQSRYMDAPLTGLSPASAACSLIADLSQAYVDDNAGCVALHCGAVQINTRLVILTGAHRAGKSTLVTRLTAEPDMRVFCDDVLPIEPDEQGAATGVALGVAPRLRLPLPANVSTAFRRHVAQHSPVHDHRYAYVCAPGRAPFGTRAPISTILVIDRHDTGPAALHQMAADTAMRHLFARNLAELGTAQNAFETMHALVSDLTCLRLVYSDLEEAVALLRRAFGGAQTLNPDVPLAPDLGEQPTDSAATPPADPHQCWRHTPQVALRRVGGSHFLWLPDDPTLLQLNPLASAIWALLEIPGSAVDLAETLAEVFPEQPKGGILSDTALLLSQLAAQGMIEPC